MDILRREQRLKESKNLKHLLRQLQAETYVAGQAALAASSGRDYT